jgi:acyl carrier protein
MRKAIHLASTPEEFWNSMSPAERLGFIEDLEAETGETIGHSNSKQTFKKLPAKLTGIIVLYLSGKFSPEESSKSETVADSSTKTAMRIRSVIAGSLGIDSHEIEESSSIIDDLGADSLDAVEIIMNIEKEFDIAITDEDAERLSTFGEIVKHVEAILNGTLEEETSTPAPSEDLDLCISFDDTGSMSSVRKQVRNQINSLVKQLFNDIPKLRVGIIIHNDYCDMPRHIFTQDFTNDLSQIEKFVNRDSPCGGGDAPECYELALHEASMMSWKSDRRALIMIGDEVPHQVGYRYGSHVNNIDWMKETRDLAAMNVKVYGVQALGRRSSNSFYENISRITGGIKLDLSQFQHIPTYINAIAYHQSGQLDTYQASDPTFNTNLALKNMFNRLKGGAGTLAADKIELLSKFQVMNVETDGETTIRDFVEMNGCTFSRGKGYYQLIERTADGKANSEVIQADKEVLFIDRATGEAISDTHWCREQLGVPYGIKATVRPLSIPGVMSKYDVFVQSNSYTRKLDPGCKFLYELEAR